MAAAFPLATVLYYGPDDRLASKCVITIYVAAGVAGASKSWRTAGGDVRRDAALADEMEEVIRLPPVGRVAGAGGADARRGERRDAGAHRK